MTHQRSRSPISSVKMVGTRTCCERKGCRTTVMRLCPITVSMARWGNGVLLKTLHSITWHFGRVAAFGILRAAVFTPSRNMLQLTIAVDFTATRKHHHCHNNYHPASPPHITGEQSATCMGFRMRFFEFEHFVSNIQSSMLWWL